MKNKQIAPYGIQNKPGNSSYFGGGHSEYGKYQWNIKYYGFHTEDEIESARFWALGEYIYVSFDHINEVVGRKVAVSLEGRSSGWLTIHEDLTKIEVAKISKHIKNCLKGLPAFLKEERRIRSKEKQDRIAHETTTRAILTNNKALKGVCSRLRTLSGYDVTLSIRGIPIDISTGLPFPK